MPVSILEKDIKEILELREYSSYAGNLILETEHGTINLYGLWNIEKNGLDEELVSDFLWGLTTLTLTLSKGTHSEALLLQNLVYIKAFGSLPEPRMARCLKRFKTALEQVSPRTNTESQLFEALCGQIDASLAEAYRQDRRLKSISDQGIVFVSITHCFGNISDRDLQIELKKYISYYVEDDDLNNYKYMSVKHLKQLYRSQAKHAEWEDIHAGASRFDGFMGDARYHAQARDSMIHGVNLLAKEISYRESLFYRLISKWMRI
jgi:hypothetical protein